MRLRLLSILGMVALTVPTVVQAQGIAQIMSGMVQGGGWVSIPIDKGHGSFSSFTLPTAAMSVSGCVNVWFVHSGTWEIEARESVLGSVLRIDAEPGTGVPFEHDFGMTAQVDVDFKWSEPRDTTLYLWVGLDRTGEGAETVCEPPEGG
jgi:hypothetical protein